MAVIRGEEEWARSLIEAALGLAVVHHDDGSRPGMHDLEIRHPDTTGAVEITTIAEEREIELWNLLNAGDRWIAPQIAGGWLVTIDAAARFTRLRKELPSFLGLLEAIGVSEIQGLSQGDMLQECATSLGVLRAFQGGTQFPGSIYVDLDIPSERASGVSGGDGNALADWVGDVLSSPKLEDVRRKLAASGAPDRHAFLVVPGLTPAPFSIVDQLIDEDAPLPVADPRLPIEITHVWVVSTWSTGAGFRWAPTGGWSRFRKTLARIP